MTDNGKLETSQMLDVHREINNAVQKIYNESGICVERVDIRWLDKIEDSWVERWVDFSTVSSADVDVVEIKSCTSTIKVLSETLNTCG